MTSWKRMLIAALLLAGLGSVALGVHNASANVTPEFANAAFRGVWARTDYPVLTQKVARTWFWGPNPNTPGLIEPNQESPGGTRVVQYFDKSRMELNNPQADPNSQFYVTNGLLTVELISGRMQVGSDTYVNRYAACIPVTGDAGEVDAPTYSAMQKVSNTTLGDHFAGDMTGVVITATISRDGTVGTDRSMTNIQGTKIKYFDTVTKHNIPQVFWDFLNQQGPVYVNNGISNATLINPWYYASGRPISEAYWTKATIAGKKMDVMVQMFERRALTYVPTYVPGWQVEMTNIGQHYYDWRYNGAGSCSGTPQPTVQRTEVPITTGTPEASPVASMTATVEASPMASETATVESSPVASETATVEASPSAETSPTVEASPSAETSPTVEASPSAEASPTAEASPSAEASPTAEASPSVEASPTAVPSGFNSPTPTP